MLMHTMKVVFIMLIVPIRRVVMMMTVVTCFSFIIKLSSIRWGSMLVVEVVGQVLAR